MQGKDPANFESGRYIATGFSTDEAMGDDTVIECVFHADGTGTTYISYNGPSFNTQLFDATRKMLRPRTALLKDGYMICQVDIDLTKRDNLVESEKKHVLDIKEHSWILQFARGLADPETGKKAIHSLGEDDLYPWTTGEEVAICRNCARKFTVVKNMQQF
ncbi:hypothetical protein QR680_000012 [Steinernema hermaphroditum]|uniref:DOMON domain-containing protein n=1 Tax=Steinernema hermaphroditum TaxID=289476 RepID=A0AA39GSY3_9BILA|nr:hypothetical protein QR680_000012 [Steinernema hermaphroditum]